MSLTIALGRDVMPGRGVAGTNWGVVALLCPVSDSNCPAQDHAAIVERITAASRMFDTDLGREASIRNRSAPRYDLIVAARAVLILRDVLGWHATEVAGLLDMSVPAANSALHRARRTLARGYAPVEMEPGRLRSLLDRYVQAWEAADIAGLVALLRHDAVVSMPPGVMVAGRDEIGVFLARSVFVEGLRIRLRPIRAKRRNRIRDLFGCRCGECASALCRPARRGRRLEHRPDGGVRRSTPHRQVRGTR
jgi:Sigma-70, region 4